MNCNMLVAEVIGQLVISVPQAKVITEFPERWQDLPLRGPTILVGVHRISVESGNDAKNISEGNSPAKVTVRMCVCVPKTSNGLACSEIVDKVVIGMWALIRRHTICDIKAGKITYNPTLLALNAQVDVTFNEGNIF